MSEWSLGAKDLGGGPIVTGPDGNLWLGAERYVGRGQFNEQTFDDLVDRITPGGDVTTFPADKYGVTALAPGSDGNVWFLSYGEVGYISATGQITRFTVPGASFLENGLVAGSDGNMWATERNDSGGDRIIRISPTGEMTSFPLPRRENGPSTITAGPEGNLWFGETFGQRVGRITTAGLITEISVGERVSDLFAASDGNIWFDSEGLLRRLSPEGKVTRFDLGRERFVGSPIIAGPDGRLWFGEDAGWIGRISPDGRISRVRLPDNGRRVNSLTVGPEGAVWFSAVGAETCNGGGFTCMNWLPSRNVMFGRVVPGALGVSVRNDEARVRRGWAAVRLGCEEGNVSDVCRGTLALRGRKAGGGIAPLGAVAYQLHTDSSHAFRIRLPRPFLTRLRRRGRIDAREIVSREGGETVSRVVTLLSVARAGGR